MCIKESSEIEFFDYLDLLKQYIYFRKRITLLNADKLNTVLKRYFESLIFFEKNCSPNNVVLTLSSGKKFAVLIDGEDQFGKIKSYTYPEISMSLLDNLFTDLSKSIDGKNINSLIKLLNSILDDSRIDCSIKYILIDNENKYLNEKIFNCFINKNDEIDLESYLSLRMSFISSNESSIIDKQVFCTQYNFYISCTIKSFIVRKKYIEIFKFILTELEKAHETLIVYYLLINLIKYNHLFLLYHQEEIKKTVYSYYELLDGNQKKRIDDALSFSPQNIDIKLFVIQLEEYDLSGLNINELNTVIGFSLPFSISGDAIIETNEYKIIFKQIQTLFDDPIFNMLSKFDIDLTGMTGMPLTILSDVIMNLDAYTAVFIIIKDFYHPDFEIINNKIVYTDFTEKEALIGRTYYPHKEKIVSILRTLIKDGIKNTPSELKKIDININSISNFVVDYRNANDDSIYHRVYTVTNLDSFISIKKRYLDKIYDLNLSDEYLNIQKALFDIEITSTNTFNVFVYCILNLVLKKSVESRGLYQFMWNGNTPKTEPGTQPLIYTQLKNIFEIKGAYLSRESYCSNGRLDFFCTYTKNGALFKVCIEMKNAHHKDLLHGLTTQLTEYMKDEGTNEGIFLVLWYKCNEFLCPTKFNNKEELEQFLNENKPQGCNIRIMIIDCTPPIPPSKLK